MSKELEKLKASLQENIDDTTYFLENAPSDADWHYHIGYRTALKEVLDAINVKED
jgi:hypothetical protein